MIEVLAFILTLGILVTIHEYGHFWVARRCGVKVLRFSVGFGSPLLKWTDKLGTEYWIAALPLGGYVKMLDEREAPVDPSELHLTFNRKPVLSRIAVVLAGPVANLLLAVVVFWLMFFVGERGLTPQVATVQPGSLAAQAGVQPGQVIAAIDGEEVRTRREVVRLLLERLGESGELRIASRYPDSTFVHEGVAQLDQWLIDDDAPNPVAGLGIDYFMPEIRPLLSEVVAGSPAARAGLQEGDRLVAAQGETIKDWQGWVALFRSHPERPLTLSYERDGQLLETEVTPAAVELEDGTTQGQVGIYPLQQPWPETMMVEIERGVFSALGAALQETAENSVFILVSIKKLLLGQISTKNLSGPITIAKVAGASAESGVLAFATTLAMLSITLGVLNLLPIPVLDGGHLLYYLVELVKGEPLPEKVQLLGYQLGMFLLMGVMLLALYNDIVRL